MRYGPQRFLVRWRPEGIHHRIEGMDELEEEPEDEDEEDDLEDSDDETTNENTKDTE